MTIVDISKLEEMDVQGVFVRHYRITNPDPPRRGTPQDYELLRYFRSCGFDGELLAYPGERNFDESLVKNFRPHERGGCTVCQIVVNDDGTERTFEGRAYCSFSDNFCYRVGRIIATGRAVHAALCHEN